MNTDEKLYMNPFTGSVATYEGWHYETSEGETVNAVDLGEVVEVIRTGDEWHEPREIKMNYNKGKTKMNAIEQKLQSLSIMQVCEIVENMTDSFSDEADIIIEAALKNLKTRMSESAFLEFCNGVA